MPVPDQPLTVSVIVPCYNAETYLAQALDSLFSQDLPPDEVILVDDGSTDASADIARRYGPRLRYHTQQRAGAGVARNAGVELACGDCIGFLDADDVWPRDSLRRRLGLLAADPTVVCATGKTEHFQTGATGRTLPQVRQARLLGAMLVRRTVFEWIGLFDTTVRLGEAFSWLSRLHDAGARVATCDHVVLHRRIHATNTGITERDRRGDYLKVLKSVIDHRRAAAQTSDG